MLSSPSRADFDFWPQEERVHTLLDDYLLAMSDGVEKIPSKDMTSSQGVTIT